MRYIPNFKTIEDPEQEPLVVHRHGDRPASALLILVHGLGGKRYGTWTAEGKAPTEASLPKFLYDDIGDLDVGLYAYVSLWKRLRFWKPKSTSIEGEAQVLADKIREMAAPHGADAYAKIILAGHSMGGLVVRAAVSELIHRDDRQTLRALKALLLLASPTAGSLRVPTWLSWLTPDTQVLAPHNDLVTKVQETFTNRIVANANHAGDGQFVIPVYVVAAAEDAWVDRFSAGVSVPHDRKLTVRGTHGSAVKPAHNSDDAYRWIRDRVLDLLAPALAKMPTPVATSVQSPLPEVSVPARRLDVRASIAAQPSLDLFHGLPALSKPLVGRQVEIDAVVALLERPTNSGAGVVISAGVHGMAGMGKTALALSVGHATAQRFPGGQLFFPLGGHSHQPVSGSEARRRWLQHAMQGKNVPVEEGAQAHAYRSILANATGPLLVVVDDPANGNDILALQPRAGDGLLVTSRRRLPGYDVVELEALSPDHARDLLVRWCPRLKEAAELAELAERCAFLPLALEAAGRFLARFNSKPAAEYLSDLQRNRLTTLSRGTEDGPQQKVDVVLGYSLKSLGQQELSALQAVATMAGDFSRDMGRRVGDCEGVVLDELVERGLLRYSAESERFSCHDLVQELVGRDTSADSATGAKQRWIEAVLDVMMRSDEMYRKGGAQILEGQKLFGAERRHIDLAFEALRLDPTQDETLLKLIGASADVAKLSQTRQERIRWQQAGVDAARRARNRRLEGSHLGNIGNAYCELGNIGLAIKYHDESLAISREVGDWAVEANQLGNLGGDYRILGDHASALRYLQQALELNRSRGRKKSVAVDLGVIANVHFDRGDIRNARVNLEEAISITREVGDLEGLAVLLGNLGNVSIIENRTGEGVSLYEEALAISRQIGDLRRVGWLLGALGNVDVQTGNDERARERLEEALRLSRQSGDRHGEGPTLGSLGDLRAKRKDYAGAVACYDEAIAISREIRDRGPEYHCLVARGNCFSEQELFVEAKASYDQAIGVARQAGSKEREGHVEAEIGTMYLRMNDVAKATSHYEVALRILEPSGDALVEQIRLRLQQLRGWRG